MSERLTPRRPAFPAYLHTAAIGLLALAACVSSPAFANPAPKSVSHGHTRLTPVAVFGKDERHPAGPAYRALAEKIGLLLNTRSGAMCTAFCVSPDMIATASHCLFGTAETPEPDLASFQFTVGVEPELRTSALAGNRIGTTSQNVTSGTRRLAVAPPIEAVKDWALARLDLPLCRTGGIALSTKAEKETAGLGAQRRVYELAFHRDLHPDTLMVSGPCGLARTFPGASRETIAEDFLNSSRVLFHDCDTAGGSSGSPLLIDGEDGPEVIGINIGTYVQSHAVQGAAAGGAQPKSEAIANTAVAVDEIRGAVRELASRDLVDDPAGVRRLETMLKGMGLYRDKVSGRSSRSLEQAIALFEESLGRAPSGLLRRALLQELTGVKPPREPSGIETGSSQPGRP